MIKKIFTLLCLCTLCIGSAWGDSWTRVTTIKELTDGGTFIMGYEATANSGVIVPLRSADCNATTSANGYFHTGVTVEATSNSKSINMGTVTETEDYEIYVTASSTDGYINIQMKNAEGNFYGATSGGTTSNKGRLYTSGNSKETNIKPEWADETNNQFKLTSEVTGQYKYLKYNTGSPRFAYYNSVGSNIVFYKKETGPTKLSAPTGLQSANVTQTSAVLSWTADANASSYTLAYKKTADNDFTETAFTSGSTLSNLSLGTEYTWKVKAVGDGTSYETSDYSETSTFTTVSNTKYTVTFNAGTNGTCSTTSLEEESAGAGVELPSCTPNPGYVFIGWSTKSDATDADAGEAGDTYNPTANITLYAVYKEICTITWSVNGTPTIEGNPTTSVVAGEGITTLPTAPADISGMAFQGWTATQIAESSATKPTDLFTDAEHAPAITGNTTFYAVFAEVNESTETLVIKDYASANSWENDKAYKDASTANVTFKGAGTGNNCKYYTSDNSWRFYKDSNGAITITAKGNITKVELSGTSCFTTAPSGWSYKNDVFTPNAQTQTNTVTISNGDGTSKITNIAVTYNSVGNYRTSIIVKELTGIEVTGTPANFWKGGTFNHDGITVTAHYSNAEDEDVTEKAEFSAPDMSTVGNKTVTVTYQGQTDTYDIIVKSIVNTKETAYTVAEAKAIINANPAELTTTEVYVKGTVSDVDKIESGAITYWLDSKTFEVYKGKNIENENFTSADEISVGDDVVVYGKIKKYYSTYEFDAGNYLVSHVKASTLEIKDITVSLGEEISPEITSNVSEAERTITYSVASEDVVKVQDGKLVTVAVGGPVTVTATLTAEGYKDATTTFTVEVIKALQSIAVKTASTTTSYKAGDKFDPTGLVITAKYNDESTEDVAYAGNEDKFTFTPSLETALTTENTSVTITYAGKETTQTITVRALYTYDITWMANGEKFKTTQVTEGDALVLPITTPANVGDMKFMGWIAAESYYDASEAPEYIVPADIIPTEAMTFYAVFAKHTSELQEKDVTYTFTSKAWTDATSSWTSGKEGNEYTKNQGVQVTSGVTGANATSKSEFTEVTKVVVNYCTNSSKGKGTISVKVGDGTPQTYSVSAPSSEGTTLRNTDDMIFGNETGKVNITVECGTNSIYINSITITSKVGEETISNYCTRFANVEITTAKYATLGLPYAVTIPTGVSAYTATVSENIVTMTKIQTGKIPANCGVILYAETPKTYTFTETADVDAITGNQLVAALEDYTCPEADKDLVYYLGKDGDNAVFKKLIVGGTIAAGKAYLKLNEALSGNAKLDVTFGEPTGIKSLTPALSEGKEVYNLNGMKVNSNYKGIVIMNGKKFINK